MVNLDVFCGSPPILFTNFNVLVVREDPIRMESRERENSKVDESDLCPPRVSNILARIGELEKSGPLYRSQPPHIGRAFEEKRLFGGQCIIQAYLAAIQARPNQTPTRLDTVFYVGGSAIDPVDYYVKDEQPDSLHLRIETRQESKLLNCTNVRYMPNYNKRLLQPIEHGFPQVPHPSKCLPLKELLKRVNFEGWSSKNSNCRFLQQTYEAWRIFEVRPTDPYFVSGQSNEIKPTCAWFRLRRNLQNMSFCDKKIILLLMSDYMVALPTAIAYDQNHVVVKSMASLSHSVTFHTDSFDPYGFFLVVEKVDHIQGTSLLNGFVYSEDGQLVISFKQQNLFQLTDRNSRSVPKL